MIQTDQIESAISSLEQAAEIIDDSLRGRCDYAADLRLRAYLAREQLVELRIEQPVQPLIDPDYVPDTCECSTCGLPPCSFCTSMSD